MSMIHDDRVNRLYSHSSSVAERAPAKPVSEMGKINLRHWDEQKKIGLRQQQEWHDLEVKHREARNRNINALKTDKLSEAEENKHRSEIEALRAKHQRQDGDMRERQRLEKERAIKAGHGAQ